MYPVAHTHRTGETNLSAGKEDYRNDPLWQRLEALSLDDPDARFPFSAKLAKQNRWTPQFARQAIAEYKRFIYLCCISPCGASPSPVIDEVWHLHLTYTQHYWEELCEKTIARKLHHHPSKGGAAEKHRHTDWYQETLNLYQKTFGTIPPVLFWSQSTPAIPKRKAFSWSLSNPFKWGLAIIVCMFLSGCGIIEFGVTGVVLVLFIAIFSSMASDANAQYPGNKNKSSNEGGNSGCGSGGCGGGGCGGGGGGGCGG